MSERIVLITGVGGGGVGEQLLKALRLAPRKYLIVGSDTQYRSAGLSDVDVPVMLPSAYAPGYVDAVSSVCERLGVRGVFPGSEPELKVLMTARRRLLDAGVVLFANSDEVVATGLDKARTLAFLEANGFSSPRSLLVQSAQELAGLPFLPAILKPNTGGGGSANVFVAQTRRELELFGTYLLETVPSLLAQEYVGTPADEYTVGVLSDLDGTLLNSIAVRRNILTAFSNRSRVENRTGNSAFGSHLVVSNGISQGEVGPFPEVSGPCERMSLALGSRGPLNIQCRLVDGVVKVFEINPRFSGTASLRALVGFNEPDLLYRRHVEAEVLSPRFSYRSGYVTRGLREVVADPALLGANPGAADFAWRVPALPFIYRPLATPSNGHNLPDALPFTVTVDPTTGLVKQLPSPEVADALLHAYAVGSEIPGLMEEQGIGRQYADDFIELLTDAYGTSRFDMSVLEIGCGTGYLLSRLRDQGASVVGIEPGPHGQLGAERSGLQIVRGFFPHPAIVGPFDLVVLYLVLEHLEDPNVLLSAIRTHLAPGGQIALVVPDAESFLQEGDVSTLFHEHYAYFTCASLAATLRECGARGLRIRRSNFSKLIFATLRFDGAQIEDVVFDRSLASSMALAHGFRSKVTSTADRISRFLSEARALGEQVAIYVPARFANYVMLADLLLEGVRFFDDSPAMQGRYFPGIAVPVESSEALVANPCQRVLIMSTSFGTKIKARIIALLPPTTQITLLDELA
jgi:carbamoyl-phosphate synthase large subunit